MSKPYCGIRQPPKGRARGSFDQCIKSGQVRYYGVKAEENQILNYLEEKRKIINENAKKRRKKAKKAKADADNAIKVAEKANNEAKKKVVKANKAMKEANEVQKVANQVNDVAQIATNNGSKNTKRTRGRPRKNTEITTVNNTKRTRGRPRKK